MSDGYTNTRVRAVTAMLKQGAGFSLMCLGGMTADSEKLWLPYLLVIIGMILVLVEGDN